MIKVHQHALINQMLYIKKKKKKEGPSEYAVQGGQNP